MSTNITKNQKEILDFIRSFSSQNGYSPTYAEIAKYFGFKSKGTVQHYIAVLEEKGFLEKSWHTPHGLSISSHHRKDQIPLEGKVAAGKPIEHLHHHELVDVPQDMIQKKGSYFALQVVGDSMLDEGILEDDYVIIRQQETAENGQIIVAQVQNEATIKRFFKKKSHIELHSANRKYKPILIEDTENFTVLGILCGLIRYQH
jgi:repressor LexA